MEVKVNLSLDREEAKFLLKSLFRYLNGEPIHNDWHNVNEIVDELEKVLNVKSSDI
jgi:hypothetical protein